MTHDLEFTPPLALMSSSVLRNVIQPRHVSLSAVVPSETETPAKDGGGEDMGQVLGALVENAPVAMAMFDHHMRYILANRAWVEEFGLRLVQPLVGKSQYDVFPGLHPGWRQVYERSLQGHVIRSEHDAMSGPDGTRVVYRWEVRPWRRHSDASVGGLMVICEKFGQQGVPEATGQSGEEKTSEPQNEAAFVDSDAAMVIVDAKGLVLRANSAAAQLCLSRGIQEGVTGFWDILADGRHVGMIKQEVLEIIETLKDEKQPGTKVVNLKAPVPQAWGQTVEHDSAGGWAGRWLFSRNKKAASDEWQFTTVALPAEPVMRVPVTPPNLPAIASAVTSISQPPAAESLGVSLEIRRLQDDLARAKQELRTLHEAQRTFAQRDARAKQFLDVLHCGVLVLDELGAPVFQNEPLTRLLGRPLQKDDTVEQWLASACPNEQHREAVTVLWREDVWRRQLTRIFSLATSDGLLKELEFQPISLPGGGLLLSIQDTTEKCRQEEQLRAVEAKFRTLLQESPLPVVLMDKTGFVFEVNHCAESFFGHAKNELRRHALDSWLDAESGEARRQKLQDLNSSGSRSASLDVRVVVGDKEPQMVKLHLAQVSDAEGEPHCTIHFFEPQPVVPTQRVETPMAAAMESENLPATLTQESQVLLLKTNVHGRIKECTERGQQLLGISAEDVVGRPLHQYFKPSDASGFYAELSQLAANVNPVSNLICYAEGGIRHPCRIKVTPRGAEGYDFELYEMSEITVEVPEITQACPESEPAVPASTLSAIDLAGLPWPVVNLEREKLLLSETHHRIKNHLQIISSLLNLESNTITDSVARGALRSSQNRVRAIADLHQHLFKLTLEPTESFVDFANGLLDRLRECYQVTAERITVALDLQEGAIQQEWLMPLALTLNETLSNCFEHAFPEDRDGHVEVSLNFERDSGELVVLDNGVGLSARTNSSATGNGLGLKILAVFADQMRGKLTLGTAESGGTEIRLRFPIASADI